MEKLIISVTAITIILILILASCWWYRHCASFTQEEILSVMYLPRWRLIVGTVISLFFSLLTIASLFLQENYLIAFVCFFCFTLLGIYLCITTFLWRCVIQADSLTFYTPLLPAKKIKFYEIDFVHCTDSTTFGLSGQKTLVGYHHGKKLFSIEEDIIGFPILCCLLHESRKLEYIPVPLFSSTSKQPAARIQVRESFSLSETRTEQISSVISSVFLILCSVYVLWNQTEFELFYQIIAVIMLLFFVPNLFHNLFWKVTVDYHSISIRRFPFLVKTYEIRQITAVVETQNHITLYAGPKKVVKIAKASKNFPYLFERLLRTEAQIYTK